MNPYQFLSGLIKYRYGRVVLILVAFTFGFGDICAQHLFSVSYGDLSQTETRQIKEQFARSGISIMPLTRSAENEYAISLSSVQNTKIIILNEETGKNVVITPTEDAPVQFRLQSFFIEELRQSAMGDADSYLIIETDTDLLVRSAASFWVQPTKVFIPRYFYGQKEDIKEALPKDRQITNIFKEKPRLIPAFPDNPENLRYIAQLEEEMNYYVYMYKLPDGTLCIYDEHFNPSVEENEVRASTRAGTNLQFNLSGNLDTQQEAATKYACDLWAAELSGMVPIDIDVYSVYMNNYSTLGRTHRQPHYWNPTTETWYCSALGNQLAGYNFSNLRDISIEMNSTLSWFYGITGSPTSNEYDWITVMLHEITHGLGFSSLIYWDKTGNNNGRFLYTTSSGFGTFTDDPGIFERQLYQGTTGNTCLADLNQNERKILVESNNLYAGRPSSYLLAANNGNRVKMYAPSRWEDGSSVSHWDNSINFTTFMKHLINKEFRCVVINAREIAIMRDMGWEIPPSISGSDIVCSSATYTLSRDTATSWSVTSGFTIDSYTDTSATVTTLNVDGKTGTLTAIVNGTPITKSIQSCQASILGTNVLCLNTPYTYTLTDIPYGLTPDSTKWSAGIIIGDDIGEFPVSPIGKISRLPAKGITLSSPTLYSVVATSTSTPPLIVAAYPLPSVGMFSAPITAQVYINDVVSVISKKIHTGHLAGTIAGPMEVGTWFPLQPTQAGYYKFTAGSDVPSNATVRWVAAPKNSSNPNATSTLYSGHSANIYLDCGLNEVRMQYVDNCANSIPAVKEVLVICPNRLQTTNSTTEAETFSVNNELNVKLSPNPVVNSLNVTVEDATPPIDVTVYSSSGTMYLSQTFTTPTFTMDLSRCQSGMLVVRISCGNKYVIKNILKL